VGVVFRHTFASGASMLPSMSRKSFPLLQGLLRRSLHRSRVAPPWHEASRLHQWALVAGVLQETALLPMAPLRTGVEAESCWMFHRERSAPTRGPRRCDNREAFQSLHHIQNLDRHCDAPPDATRLSRRRPYPKGNYVVAARGRWRARIRSTCRQASIALGGSDSSRS